MTANELRNTLPTMVIWMAKEAVMEGVKSYHKSQRENKIQADLADSGKPFNFTLSHAYYDGVRVAAEVLWKLFQSCAADCMDAIRAVAETRDGYSGDPDNYFDDFVVALEKRLRCPVRIRTEE